MKTEQIIQTAFEVNGVQGAFLANKNGIAFMFFDQDGDRINKFHPAYKKEINELIGKADSFADCNHFNYSVR